MGINGQNTIGIDVWRKISRHAEDMAPHSEHTFTNCKMKDITNTKGKAKVDNGGDNVHTKKDLTSQHEGSKFGAWLHAQRKMRKPNKKQETKGNLPQLVKGGASRGSKFVILNYEEN
ncbi:hypothetical protein Nepgr_008813 [Nepenthes gracilis]|uniref:Uncharacterized protein n=1 Tax=Nepenthes gracilis TaxID=150966 RepID=A0AAD3XJL4_NEPGR|nr:hypothetical protein Nepgr_008813 [Nepenthes gracilis]